jgi:subtilisin family serine protease
MSKRYKFSFLVFLVFVISACSEPDRFESVMPNKSENCGGSAIKSKYIVRFKSGQWDYVEHADRESFKLNYVVENFEEIDFIEYDQRITVDARPQNLQRNDYRFSDVHSSELPLDVSIETPLSPNFEAGVNNWGADAINADAAWRNQAYGQDVIVAVIDTGVDTQHSQLNSQIAYNLSEIPSNNIDDDKNGFVDDYEGYNFVSKSGELTDDVGHGTHVAGIIAAAHSDKQIRKGYVQGVAPQAKILPVKFLGENGGNLSDALRGIDYAVKRGAKVINASWGGTGCSNSLRQKVRDVANNNVLFVAAAGNSGANLDNRPEYPAAFNLPTLVTVGALTSLLNMSSYSNFSASRVHLFAPGSAVVSTTPGNNYAGMSGTSMAAPFVSGAAAVLFATHPQKSVAELRQLLFDSTDFDANLMSVTQGRLNLARAYQ